MYTLDRFARNRYDSAIYKAKLKKNGVRVYYAKQPMPDTPEGIILESVLEGYAEYYSENLARNIKRGIRENALQGLATGGANLLLGYTVGEDRKYAIDPTGAKIVQEIFQLYADGMSATQIIAYCNERGYKTARGNAFNKNSLRTILRNEKYIGTYKLMDIVIPDGMPAIIDKVLFEKVQAMLKHNGKARAKAKAHENYLLTTKLFCGHCGSPMVGESGTSKTGQVHYYYKCTKAKREHACKKKSERKDWIEKLVVRYTVQNVLTDENIALIAKRAMEIIEKESADTTYLDGLNAELKDVQKKIKNLVSAIEQGIITSATKDRLDELEQEKSDIEGRIAREEMKKPLLNESRIRYWLTSFKSGNVDDEDYQRRVIDTLVNSVYVYDDEDGGKRIVLTFNLSGNNTATLTSSDIECYAPVAVGAVPHQVTGLGGDDQLVAVDAEVVPQNFTKIPLGSARLRAVVVGKVKVGDAVVKRRAAERAHILIRGGVTEIMPQPQRDSGQHKAAGPAAAVGDDLIAVLCGLVHGESLLCFSFIIISAAGADNVKAAQKATSKFDT